jgi:transposase
MDIVVARRARPGSRAAPRQDDQDVRHDAGGPGGSGRLAEAEGLTHAGMEATGVYWMPVYGAIEAAGRIEAVLANARHIKKVPGRKTDVKDAQWIAQFTSPFIFVTGPRNWAPPRQRPACRNAHPSCFA